MAIDTSLEPLPVTVAPAASPKRPEARQLVGRFPQRAGRPVTARVKLLEAAYRVMGRKGLDASTVAEIIAEAGVGVGSFYKHFVSKEDLARAVFTDRAERFGLALQQVVLSATNMAAAACFVFRHFIEEVESDQLWASFIIQLEPAMQLMDSLLRDHARTALTDMVADGRLRINDIENAITAHHALMLAFAKARLQGRLSSWEAHRASRFSLLTLGVPEPEAVRLAELPMELLKTEIGRHPRHAGFAAVRSSGQI